MERQSRIQKYKDLRDEMKEEVAINRHIDETPVEDDDFLSFMPQTKTKTVDDTLMEPLSYETLDEDSSVQSALNEAKVNVGKEQYNTRLDILNKIKKEETYTPAHLSREEVKIQEEPQKKMSLLEKLAAMSPEEDADELRKYEEELSVEELMKSQKEEKKVKRKQEVKVKKEKVLTEEIEDEDEVEEESRVVTILNYVILAFIVVFVVLIGFIVKQMFF